jgi:hypothetical protein
MNFDDIMNGGLGSLEANDLGKDITDIFGVNTEKAKNNVKDLMTLLTETDSTDSDIIRNALLLTEDKNELAVVMHLTMKALVSKIVDQANEMADLLDDTRAVLEDMGDDVTEKYAMGMVSRMIERMGEDDFNDELDNFRNSGDDE